MINFRNGLGWDRHQLEPGDKFYLAGIEITAEVTTVGHSDADPALHALIDALLGAAGLGDIGQHFSPGKEKWKDVSSLKLLKLTRDIISEEGWRPVNLDLNIILEGIKLAPYRQKMRGKIKKYLPDAEEINIKFKTAEKLDAVGRGKAIEAQAIVLLTKK